MIGTSKEPLLAKTKARPLSWTGLWEAFVYLAAGVAFVCTTMGFLGRYWWVFDLTSHFRIQYLALSVSIGALCVLRRRWRLSFLFLILAIVNVLPVSPYLLRNSASNAKHPPNTIRAVLINVHTQNRRFDRVRDFTLSTKPDFIVLEEVNSEWLQSLREIKKALPYSVEAAREDNFGIVLLSRHPLINSEVIHLGGAEVPSVLARIDVRGTVLTVLGTHPLPPGGREYSQLRKEQLAAIADFLNRQKGSKVLLGDLNTTPWNHYFRQLVEGTGLTDSARGFGLQPTWPTSVTVLRIPIDHCLLSPDLKAVERTIGPNVGSDHFPLIVDFVAQPAN